VSKEVIKYKRKDVELSGTLYLPVGYDKTKKEKKVPSRIQRQEFCRTKYAKPNEFTFPNYGSLCIG
jgi:hypothetical protein